MKKLTIIKGLLLLTGISSFSQSITSDGRISQILMDESYGQKVFLMIEPSSKKTSEPTCNSGIWDYQFETSSLYGKEWLSIVLTAYTTKSQIYLEGTGICPSNNVEKMRRINLK